MREKDWEGVRRSLFGVAELLVWRAKEGGRSM